MKASGMASARVRGGGVPVPSYDSVGHLTPELEDDTALLQQLHPRSGTSLLALLAQAEPHAQLVAPEPAALAALPADQWLLAASHTLPAVRPGGRVQPL